MILLLKNNIRGGISSVMSDRYVKPDENKKILYIDAIILYGHSRCQLLPDDGFIFDKNVCLEDVLNTPDGSDIGYFIEVELEYPNKKKKKQKTSLLLW